MKPKDTEEYRCVLDEIRKQCSTPFRMRGHQKEMRYDLPMVYVALVIDEHGLPLDFQCYPGNSSEQKTMVESIRKLKEKYDFKHAVLVADNGLNSTANLRMLLSEGLGFSVAQSVYTLPRDCIDAHLRDLKAFSPIPGESELRYKLVPYEKTSYIRDEATGEREKVSVSCHLLLTYSEERRQHDLAVLNRHIEQARRYIHEAASALNAAPGSHQFCVADCNDGEIRYTGLNYALIEKYRRLAGFSGVLFQEPPDFKGSFEPGYVASLYHKLVRTEECFRIMKNNFEIRPMYVWTEPHIKGHVLLCVLALLQLRLLQQRMEEKQTPLNINDLCAELSDLEIGVVPTAGNEYCVLNLGYFADEPDTLTADASTKSDDSHTDTSKDKLIAALGYEPLPLLGTLSSLRNHLHLRQLELTSCQKSRIDNLATIKMEFQ